MCGTLAEAVAKIKKFLESKEEEILVVTAGTEEERAEKAGFFKRICKVKCFQGDTYENERYRTGTSVKHGCNHIFAFGASTCHILWFEGGVSLVYKKNPSGSDIEEFKRFISSYLTEEPTVAAGLLAVVTPFEEGELWKTVPSESFDTFDLGPKAENAIPYIGAFKEETAGRSFKVGNRKNPTSYVTDAFRCGEGKISGGDIKTIEALIAPFTLEDVMKHHRV